MTKPLTVLILTTDTQTQRSCENGLRIYGYNVLTARTGIEAAKQLELTKIDVLVTDADTGGEIDGLALAVAARARHPKVEVIYTSSAPHRIPDARRVPRAPSIRAPYGPFQVSGVIHALKHRPAMEDLPRAA